MVTFANERKPLASNTLIHAGFLDWSEADFTVSFMAISGD